MKTDNIFSDYMYNFVETICKKFGPRYSCSKAEKDANLWIKDELDNYCDETFIDEYQTHPNMYPQGIFKIVGILAGIAFIFMPFIFPISIFSFIFIILAIFTLFSELFFMKEWIRPFFKKGTSSNVFGKIKPTGEIKFRIIFEGHTDSAKQMNLAKFEVKAPLKRFFLGIYYLVHTIIFSLLKFFTQLDRLTQQNLFSPLSRLINGDPIVFAEWWIFQWTIYDWIYFISLIVIYPFFIYLISNLLGNTVVMGANDNLAASAVSAAIGKYLSTNRPKNVEVWVGSQGSEEVGDKGAKAFVAKYGKELKNAYAVVLDSCGAGTEIFLIHKDTMHVCTYSMEVIEKIQQAYEQYKKENPDAINCRIGRIALGSCDACRYVKKGYKAAGLIVVDGALNKPRYWHTPQDIPENLEKNVMKDILEICLNFVEIVDRKYD
ncbi:MAG: M28 family peptidase [Candidatus Helarchaeota archaeon]